MRVGRALGHSLVWWVRMYGAASPDCQCFWQVAEPPEDWPALIWQQQRELAELRHSQEELLQRLCTQLEGLQSTVTGHVERALESRHEQDRILMGCGMAQGLVEAAAFLAPGRDVGPASGLFLSYNAERRLERALAEGQQRGGQLQEQLTQQLSQALSSAIAGRLERSIRDEIKKTVPPCEFCVETLGGPGGSGASYLSSCLSWLYLFLLTLPQVSPGVWSQWQAN